jgi:hypothetical protein
MEYNLSIEYLRIFVGFLEIIYPNSMKPLTFLLLLCTQTLPSLSLSNLITDPGFELLGQALPGTYSGV